MAAVGLCLAANGFAVGHLGRLQCDFSVVTLFEAVDDGFNMRLPRAGNQEFVSLRVAEEANEQVLFHELVNCGSKLVFVGTGFGLDGVGHGRLGHRGKRDLDLGAFLAEGVAGESVAELADGADIASMELSDFDRLAALHDAEVRELFLAAAGVVLERRFVLDDSAEDFEEADAPGEGIGHGLEDDGARGLAVGDFALGRGSVVGCGLDDGGLALDGGWRVDLEEVEKMIEGHVGEAAGEEHREDAVFADGFVERGDEVVFGYSALFEVLLHELVFAFGDELDQRLVAGLGVGHKRGGNFRRDFAAAVAAGRIGVSLHGDEIDDAVKALRVGDGQLDGNTAAAPAFLQIVNEGAQSAATTSFGVVHLIDEDDAGNICFFGKAPDALRDGLDAALGVDNDDCGFDGKECGAGFVREHVEAGRIDEVDFGALPFGKRDGVLHGNGTGYFFFVVGGGGGAVLDTALGGSHFGGMQQSGNECGFAAVSMPHYSDVSDLTSLVRFHGFLLDADKRTAWCGAKMASQAPAVRQPPSAVPCQRKGAGLSFVELETNEWCWISKEGSELVYRD